MTRFLLATRSVHTTAAAADALGSRLTASDTVNVATVLEPDMDPRDAGDAANVARTRLLPATVETAQREGDPSEILPEIAAEVEADEVVIGPRRGDPDTSADIGSTAREMISTLDVPVVVVPVPDL